ncbi:MAG TPA: adenylate/guanylate cyclase domain-containing protein [Actinomycetota bacterium]
MTTPETRFATTGDDARIAYQVFGQGSIDLVWVPGFVSHVEAMWRFPPLARFAQRLGAMARVIAFDKRGTGLSDRFALGYIPDMETRMDDVRAVMDAAGSERAVIFGISEGGPLAMLFAATYPERTVALIAYGASARSAWAPDYPGGKKAEAVEQEIVDAKRRWGQEGWAREQLLEWGAPSVADDPDAVAWFSSFVREGASPESYESLERMNEELDVRPILGAIRVPTLILNRSGDLDIRAPGSYLAERIPGSTLVELPGDDHMPWFGSEDDVSGAIGAFLDEVRHEEAFLGRVLATVLFTDIVDSTASAASEGDLRWREVVDEHDRIVRGLIARYQGREIKTMGDGFLATFDGPARAIRSATSIVEAVRRLGIEVRAGLHTGECEMLGDDVGGISVAIGARVGAKAGPSEVLVSQTVKDLVAGSGLRFEDAGEHELKGVPDRWRLYRVVD